MLKTQDKHYLKNMFCQPYFYAIAKPSTTPFKNKQQIFYRVRETTDPKVPFTNKDKQNHFGVKYSTLHFRQSFGKN